MNARALVLLPIFTAAGLAACTSEPDPPPPEMCAATLPQAMNRCTAAGCTATTDPKVHQEAVLTPGKWIVISSVTSELNDNENINVDYGKAASGGLLAQRLHLARPDLKERVSADVYELLWGASRMSRLKAEHLIRSHTLEAPVDLDVLEGTGIRGRSDVLIPKGASRQAMTCTQAAPTCGTAALCVIPAGTTSGTCEGMLTIKWRDQNSPGQFEDVAATVRKVGMFGAIVTDDADNVPATAIDEVLKRFDEHIAPLDHQFFGEPKNMMGRDRDGNGVVILFMTSKVAGISTSLAGFFQSIDLGDPATTSSSNGADILYMQPPGANVSLDQLSGTVGHEYQHLINYYAKVVNRQSSAETVWLDEGLASFAEDMLGYGEDALKNIAAYLIAIGDTSLTGNGLLATDPMEADSNARRGMAQLLVRYYFEQKGGATFAGPASATDGGGVAAVKALVQASDTGIELFTMSKTGRTFDAWVTDLLTAVAVDGANYPDVSCNAKVSFEEPETDAYTMFQRGVDLRKPVTAGGRTIPLNGPMPIPTFEAEMGVPIPSNGGEIRSVVATTGTVLSISGPAEDYKLGIRALPTEAMVASGGTDAGM